MPEVIVDGVRYLPMKRKTTKHQRPLSELIKDAREVKRESLEEAARHIGIVKPYLWELEQGTSQPTLPVLQKLLYHFGIEFNEIAEAKR